MIVSMRGGLDDGRVVDGGANWSTLISSVVASKRGDIGDSRITYGVMVSGAITFDIVASRKEDLGDDGEVTCGVVVSRINFHAPYEI